MPERNVVLISTDQWRGDCLSIDGHPVVETPFLDWLASRGTRYVNAYSATPSCIPARTALMTGLSQRSHGRVGYADGVPWEHRETLPKAFGDAGYQTQAIGKMHISPPRARAGFDHVLLHDGYLHHARRETSSLDEIDDYVPWLRGQLGHEVDCTEHGIGCNSFVARPWDKPERTHPSNFVAQEGIRFLTRRDPTSPFFLYLSFHRPHPPYDPPRWAFDQYRDVDMPDPPVGDWASLWAPYAQPHNPARRSGAATPAQQRRAMAGYYGHMTHIDQQIHRFFEALDEHGVLQDTVLCFVSDHGEMMGDHHLFAKTLPYEGSARIPFFLTDLSRDPVIPAGRESLAVAELRDVMPTLLAAAGIDHDLALDGLDLGTAPAREYLHGEHVAFGQSIQWLTDGATKYVWCSQQGHEQLFDLDDDPQELHDLVGRSAYAEVLARWRARMVSELEDRPEGYSDGQALIAGQEPRLHIEPLPARA